MVALSSEDQAKYTAFYQIVAAESEDGSDGLNMEDFEKLVSMCGHIWSRPVVASVFVQVDIDGDWKLSLDEFLAFISQVAPSGSPESLASSIRRRFNQHDLNKDGYISFEELKTLLSELNFGLDEEWMRTFMKDWDTDGDGRINFEEFVNMYVRTELMPCDSDNEDDNKQYEKTATEVKDLFVAADRIRMLCREKDLIEDGMVQADDIRSVMIEVKSQLSDAQVESCITTLDVEGSGKIPLEEFVSMFETMCSEEVVDEEQDLMKDEEEDPVPEKREQEKQLEEEQREEEYHEQQREEEYHEQQREYREEIIAPAKVEGVQAPVVCNRQDGDIAKLSAAFAGKKETNNAHKVSGDDGAKKECKEVGVRSMVSRWENKAN